MAGFKAGSGKDQSEVRFGDEICERKSISTVSACDFRGEFEMGRDERVRSSSISELVPAARELLLFLSL